MTTALNACALASTAETPRDARQSILQDGGEYLPDFSFAGYDNGESPVPTLSGTVIDVTRHGAVPDDEVDDSDAILSALAEAETVEGTVIVSFPEGRLIVTEILPVTRGNIVLRGKGSGEKGTVIAFPRPLAMVDTADRFDELREYLQKYDKRQREPKRNINYLFSEYSWTGGFIWVQKPSHRPTSYLEKYDPPISVLTEINQAERGGRTLRVDSTRKLEVGMVVQLQWFNRDGEEGALLDAIYGDTDLKIGSHHWTFPERPLVRQMTRIVAIDGQTVTISDTLLHDISAELPAQIAEWEHLSDVGIEDMRLEFPDAPSFGHHLERGYNGIYFTSVFDGWIRDVTIVNADSGILTSNAANLTIQNINIEGNRRAHYGVHIGSVHNVLVSDLTVSVPVIHPLTFNTQSTRSVYQRAILTEAPVFDQHAGSNHQNLFDDITVFISARRDERGPFYHLWDGSGAGYWEPGHGRFNTSWNINVIVRDGADRDETVRLLGLAEGPDARIVGIRGNRPFELEYVPSPYVEALNSEPPTPSLYDWQLRRRNNRAKD